MKNRIIKIFSGRRLINLILVGLFLFVCTISIGVSGVFEWQYETQNLYYNGNTKSNKVSLMINVYWGTEYLSGILDILHEKSVKTTFFIGGTWAEKNGDMLDRIVKNGHEIGSHGYFHKSHDKLDYNGNFEEINVTHQLIKKMINVEMNLFAPPSGAFSNTTIEVATSLGYKTIMWTRDTVDWRDKDTDIIYNRAVKDAKGGDLILMHPTENTLQALPKIIDTIISKSMIITTVSDCLN